MTAIQSNHGGHRRIFAFNQYERDAWVTKQANRLVAGSRVLDVGAGGCPYRQAFAHCEYRAHDFSRLTPDQLRGSGGYGRIDYISDIGSIPVPDACFDAILCTEVLEHVPFPSKAIREFARILRAGGRLLLTAPLGSGLHQEPYHFYGGFTPHWYQEFLSEAGFEQITVEPNGGFFKHYGQESQRFNVMVSPRAPGGLRTWMLAPVWLITFPLFRVVLPLVCHFLDRIDKGREFTVGYHVTAVRK